jgi:hypothetical protein
MTPLISIAILLSLITFTFGLSLPNPLTNINLTEQAVNWDRTGGGPCTPSSRT